MTFISCYTLQQETTKQIPEAPCDQLGDISKHHTQERYQDNDLPVDVISAEATASTLEIHNQEEHQVEEQPEGKDLPRTSEDIGKEF